MLAVIVSSKEQLHSFLESVWFLKDAGEMLIPVDSMTVGPFSCFSSCEVSFLARSNTVWNTMLLSKKFYKCVDGFADSLHVGKANP